MSTINTFNVVRIAVYTHPRKSCPLCGSVRVSRRVRSGGYRCNRCSTIFSAPTVRENK